MTPRQRFLAWVVRWRYQILGIVLLGFGLIAAISLAVFASSKTPPDGAQSAVLVLIGTALNVGGAWLFSRKAGETNLGSARMAVRHLSATAEAVAAARELAEEAFDEPDDSKARAKLGHLSVHLSNVEQQMGSNLEDWFEAIPDLPEKAES